MKYNRIYWIVPACLLFSTTLLKGQTGGESVGDHQQPSICEQWKADPGDGRAVKDGGVLCVNGEKVVCDWSSPQKASRLKDCIVRHETKHKPDITCPSESGVSRPGLPWTERRATECTAWHDTWECLSDMPKDWPNKDGLVENARNEVIYWCSPILPSEDDNDEILPPE